MTDQARRCGRCLRAVALSCAAMRATAAGLVPEQIALSVGDGEDGVVCGVGAVWAVAADGLTRSRVMRRLPLD